MIKKFGLVFLGLFLGLVSLTYADVFQKVPGLGIYLSVPKGYELSPDFSGFMNEETGGSIVIVQFPPESKSQIQSVFMDENRMKAEMQKQRFTIDKFDDIKTDQGVAIRVYAGSQQGNGLEYDKWVGISFTETGVFLMTVQSPEGSGLSTENVMKIFKSAKFSGEISAEEKIATLPFSFEVAAPFVFYDSMMGNTAILRPADDPELGEDKPAIMIMQDINSWEGKTAETAEKEFLASISKSFHIRETIEQKPIDFAGYSGRYLRVVGETDKGTLQDFILYSAMNKEGRPIYLTAKAAKGEITPYLDAIEKIAASVKFRSINNHQ